MKVLVRQFGLSFTAYLVWITAFISFAVIGYFSRKFIPDLILQIVFKYLTVVVAITWMFSYSVYTKLVDITDSAGLDC